MSHAEGGHNSFGVVLLQELEVLAIRMGGGGAKCFHPLKWGGGGQKNLPCLLLFLRAPQKGRRGGCGVPGINLNIPFRGGFRGGGVLGVRLRPPAPHFGVPPNFIKRENMYPYQKRRILVLNSYPDPPLSEILYPPLPSTSTYRCGNEGLTLLALYQVNVNKTLTPT